jgi:hypothetical protein
MSHPNEDPDDQDAPRITLGGVVPGVGILAQPTYYEIVTEHVQRLIAEGARLAALMDGVVADGRSVDVDGRTVLPIMALDRAANLLQHAAQELLDERCKATGWPTV